MLSIYRRHGPRCPQTSRRYRRCNCPIWVEGTTDKGEYLRQSLKVRNWDSAQTEARNLEQYGRQTGRITIAEVCEAFLQDARSRGLQDSTMEIFERLFKRMKEFATAHGVVFISEWSLEVLREFRATLTHRNFSARNKTENIRALFRFAHDAKWIAENPALKLKSPKTRPVPTLPLTREEFTKILNACDKYTKPNTDKLNHNAQLLKAFILLLRHSGLRIRDAVTLARERITEGKLLLYTAKTGTPVRVPLPDECLKALDAIPVNGNGPYYFWTGQGKPKTRVGNFQAMLTAVADIAEVPGVHAHRFRDTFAVELLLAGVPLERVAMLLGNTVKIVERHYAPWVAARQEQLEQDVRRTWQTPPSA